MELEKPGQRTITFQASAWMHQPGGRVFIKVFANVVEGAALLPVGDLIIDAPNMDLAKFLLKSGRDFIDSQMKSNQIVIPHPVLEKLA